MSKDSSENTQRYKVKFLRRKAKQTPGNFGKPWQVFATTILIFIVSQLLAAVFIELAYSALHHGVTSDNGIIDTSPVTQFIYILLAEGMAIWFVFGILKRRGLKLASIGLGRYPIWSDAVKALIGFAAFYGLLIISGIIINLLFPNLNDNQTQDIGFNNLNSTLDQVFALISLVILPPLGEEILVRGYLYSGLRKYWKFVPAMIATSILFGIAHLQGGQGSVLLWTAAIDTFLLSLVLVYLREYTGALYAGMLVHALNNLFAYAVHFH